MPKFLAILLALSGLRTWAEPASDSARFASLNQYFAASTYSFHSRSYFMGTANRGLLKDDFTLAQGGDLGIQTPWLHGLRFNLSGYFIYNLASSDLARPDSISGGFNRYEAGQYDLANRGTSRGLERVEQLNAEFQRRGFHAQLGRFQRETPFFNAQDGRMRPTLEEGLWLRQSLGGWTLRGASVWSISPRSTVDWYPVAQSVGIYSRGVRADGSPGAYMLSDAGKALYIAGAQGPLAKNLTLEAWTMAFPNVMHSHTAQFEYRLGGAKFRLMGLAQGRLGNGGNAQEDLTYIPEGHQAYAVSSNASLPLPRKRYAALSYTRITGHGQYLMPREWGRDPFYTFMSRERNEGLGDVHAATLMLGSIRKRGSHEINVGFYDLPEPGNYRLNKYGMPSYWQVNVAGRMRPQKAFDGLTLRYLVMYKGALGPNNLSLAQQYNKIGVWHLSLSADYAFQTKK